MTPKSLPPCKAACPVRTDAGRYARLIAEGCYEEAYKVICRTNPFPAVCAHICQRHCEKECRRGQLDAPVALRALKRFVVRAMGARGHPPSAPVSSDASRVAVIGAGPAGLTAAHDLRQQGHRVSIFERLDRPGGMLNVIPRYRLPQEALDSDMEGILAAGIEITCGCQIGRDMTAGALLDKGFSAVIVASGLSRSRGIAVPGFGAQRFAAAIPWMTDVWLGNKVDLGRRVAVIGGGNVAIDVARTARRLGAKHVAAICLESPDEIPAEPDEIELAQAEGIQILYRHALKRVLNRDGQIVALELMAVESVFDEAGRFRPTYDPARIRTLSADMVILSIGQGPDRSWATGTSIGTDERGRILADRETHVTSHPRVFLAGESLRGPGSAIEAVADGHEVAQVVAGFLATGEVVKPPREQARPLEPFPADVAGRLRQMHAVATEPEPFADGEPVMNDDEARREAGRCLGCMTGAVIDEVKCASCLTCLRVCPLEAVEIGETMLANPVRCQACGACATVCPANAIELSYWQSTDLGLEAPGAGVVGQGAEPAVMLLCEHGTDEHPPADQVLRVPCLVRLKPIDLLRLFRQGFKRITLVPCEQEECKYGTAWPNIQSVVEYVREVVADIRPDLRLDLCLGDSARQPVGELAGEEQ